MRTCKKCGLEKDESEFYGFHECKECKKLYQKNREAFLRLTNPEWVEKEKVRSMEKYHRLNYKDKHKPSPENKKEIIRKYKKKYPEKQLAKNVTSSLKRKPGFQLHHWSYNEEHFKDVIELNYKVHAKIHRYLKYDPVQKMYKSLNGEILNSREKHQLYIDSIISLPF